MKQARLPSGTVEYEDTGGDGPVLVLLHGMMMDASLWDAVTADLAADHRCVVPTLPLGAHTVPMAADADLSLPAVARLVTELLDHLGLRDVTLVGNDTGGALVQLILTGLHLPAAEGERAEGRADAPVAGAVLASCEAFDNFPPGLTGRTLMLAGRLPPRLFGLFMQQLRLRAVRRSPLAFGTLTRYGDAATARWGRPAMARSEIRRDAVRMLRAAAGARALLRAAAERLPAFDRPVLVAWAADDRVMPPEHGRRLAGLLPHARLVEIADSRTLMPLDQPAELARAVREFTRDTMG